jgi:RND superfamily putative drug exporter
VAGVAGPREQAALPDIAFATSKDGNAARYLVVLDADPLGSAGIAAYDSLRAAMPAMLTRAGLDEALVQYGGDTALAQYVVGRTLGDLARIGIAVCLLDFLLLVIFLRALFAPLYLVAASVLALAAALGLTTYLFQDLLGYEDIGYYVPFAASVLLISLGSDYNVFLVGRIWEERRRRPLRGAIETAVPRARRAISVAALALTLSFAMLAFVDLAAFRQLAFLLAVGILVDSFFVRSVFVPALVALFGRRRVAAMAEAATVEESGAPAPRAEVETPDHRAA